MNLTIGLFTAHLICSTCNDGAFTENQIITLESERYAVATLINSYDARSYVLAKKYSHNESFGVYYGLVSGYGRHYEPVMPVAAPYYTYKSFKVVMLSEAIALSYSVKLW